MGEFELIEKKKRARQISLDGAQTEA